MDVQQIKQRFGIVGNSPVLLRAIDIARQVAATDLSVLVTGESGTGKEIFPQIIHQMSHRKHAQYIAVNCGAIPEGTIDSELFGHEKGSFTGAFDKRRGYFEVADNGTIFLDEVAELPISTQAKLLRILEAGEFMKVGSSVVQKTNVRVVAATNVNLAQAIHNGKFREDLFYRLNTVPIIVPPLRERKDDIYFLFRKFTVDFSEKYRVPPITITPEALELLSTYRWPGNVRQLKNITEQISIIERERMIDAATLQNYLPNLYEQKLPTLYNSGIDSETFSSEREILYKILFDMKNDMTDLKKLVHELIHNDNQNINLKEDHINIIHRLYKDEVRTDIIQPQKTIDILPNEQHITDTEEIQEENLSLENREIELIRKALERHHGKRKLAADELGISERTLYRKIKEYDIK